MKHPGKAFVLLAIMALVSLLYVRLRFLAVEMGFKVAREQEKKATLEERKRVLTVELATLRRPKRMEELASRHLGLARLHPTSTTVVLQKDPSL